MPADRGEVWFVHRDLYIRDFASAFEPLGFSTRIVSNEQAERAGADGPAPVFIAGCDMGSPTFRKVLGRGIPFVGVPLDQWYFSPRYRALAVEEEASALLGLPFFVPFFRWNFPEAERSARDRLYLFPCGPEQVEVYRELGLRHVESLPFGVDAERFCPEEMSPAIRRRFWAPVAFIGTSLLRDVNNGYIKLHRCLRRAREKVRTAVERELCARLALFLDESIRIQSLDLFRYRLPEIIRELESSLRIHFFLPGGMTPLKETWILQLGGHISMLQRLEAVKRLAPFGIAVYGDEAWRSVDAPGMQYRGEAAWATDLPRAINGADIHVNVSKAMFDTGVGPRIFEVLACGKLLLSSRNPAIAERFEDGKEIVFYDTAEDLVDKTRYYLAHPAEREEIGRRGREKVLRLHTWLHRARRIVEVLERDGIIPQRLCAPACAAPGKRPVGAAGRSAVT